MAVHTSYTCKKCEEEIEVEVIINEEDDLPENCPNCNEPIPDVAHEEVAIAAMEQRADWNYGD